MTANGWLQIILFFLVILAITKPLGIYLHRVFEGADSALPRVLGPVERLLLRLCGVKGDETQNWKQYAAYLLGFSALGVLVTYAIQRLQHVLPFNPQNLAADVAAPGVQHRRQLHHQHQLAVVRRRVDDELLHPDGGAGLAQLRLGRRRHRRGPGDRARAHPPRRRSSPARGWATSWSTWSAALVYVLLPLSHRVRPGAAPPRGSSRTSAPTSRSPRWKAPSRPSPWGRSPRRR